MPATTFIFSFIEYSKGARKKKRRDVIMEDSDKPDGQKKPEPEPEIEIGREVISRDGFWPTWVQTQTRQDRSRDFKLRIEFSAERAEFFSVFIPGNSRNPSLESKGNERILSLDEGEEGILLVLENIGDGALQFTLLDLWDPAHIASFPAKNWQEILNHFSRSPRYGAIVEKFFEEELRQERKRAEEELKRVEEERREEERKRLAAEKDKLAAERIRKWFGFAKKED